MKKLMKAADPVSEELGRWLGRRDAFAAVAGRCSAAEVESLRRIRDDKLYRNLGLTWEDFCRTRLGTSRQYIDRTLKLLDEFGPSYFHVAQLTHVSTDEYRAIAPHVTAEGVRVDGAVVAFLPENGEQIAAAVAELVRRGKPALQAATSAIDSVLKRCESLGEAILRLGDLQEAELRELKYAIFQLMNCAEARGADVSEWLG